MALTSWEKLCGGAAIVTFVAAFLPWSSVLGASVSGLDGDGQVTLLAAIIGLASRAVHHGVGPIRFGRSPTLGIQSAAAGLVALIGILNIGSSSAIGLYATLLAGLVWVAGAVIGWRAPAPVPVEEFY
jgi:hypothetical protein